MPHADGKNGTFSEHEEDQAKPGKVKLNCLHKGKEGLEYSVGWVDAKQNHWQIRQMQTK